MGRPECLGTVLSVPHWRGACRPLEGDFIIEKLTNCEQQLDLHFAQGSIRAGGFEMIKNQKSDEKRGSLKLRSQVLKAQIRGTMFWELEK